jgi:ATP synthase gamma subunit
MASQRVIQAHCCILFVQGGCTASASYGDPPGQYVSVCGQLPEQNSHLNIFTVSIRLKSIKNIQKITASMKMVAAAKLRGAERNMYCARKFGAGSESALTILLTRIYDTTIV